MLLKTVATRNCFLPILVALVLLLSPTFIFPGNPQDQELQKKEEKSDVKKMLEKHGLDTRPEYSISLFDFLKSRKESKK